MSFSTVRRKRLRGLLKSPKANSKIKLSPIDELSVSPGDSPTSSIGGEAPKRQRNKDRSSSVPNEDIPIESIIYEIFGDDTKQDENMPLAKGIKSHSTENIANHVISRKLSTRTSAKQDDRAKNTLPLPVCLSLGISSLSDSQLYSYHNSQEFLSFLTKGARDVEEAERNNTIDTALSIIRELTALVEENTKLLNFIRNTQEYNPTSEIDDVMVQNITRTLAEYRFAVSKLRERAKEYKNQLILAESDLDTNDSQDMKVDLLAMRKTLSWMSMIVRYHIWGSSVADEPIYYSDDEALQRTRKLSRQNCIRVRGRPKWSERDQELDSPPPPAPAGTITLSSSAPSSLKLAPRNNPVLNPGSNKVTSLIRR